MYNILQQTQLILQQRERGQLGLARKRLKDAGLNGTISPLWSLRFFRRSFFQRHAICYTHVMSMGLAKRCLLYMGRLLSREKIHELNRRVESLPRHPTLKHLQNGLFRLNGIGKFRGISIEFVTAEDIESFLQSSVLVLWRLVPDPLLKVICNIQEAARVMINLKEFSNSEELREAQMKIDRAKKSFVSYFKGFAATKSGTTHKQATIF